MTDSENSAAEPKKRFWLTLLRPKVAIPLGLLVLLLLSPVLFRGWNLGHIPDLGDPFSEQPPSKPKLSENDNAWVNYRKADELWEKQTEIDHRLPRPAPYYYFRNIASSGISVWRKSPETSDLSNIDGFFPTVETLTRDLNLYREGLEEWKTGTGKSRYEHEERGVVASLQEPYVDSGIGIWDQSGWGPTIQQLAIARAGQLASQGKAAEALEWMLAVYRYARHLTQSGGTRNWFDANLITSELFSALDELFDDDLFTPEMMIEFLHELEQARELTGDFEQALSDDYFVLKQRILDAHKAVSHASEEPEAGSSAAENSRFKLYVRGEPQYSLRFLQHHYEYLKQNLKKPVPDRVRPINGADWDSARGISGLLDLYRKNTLSNQASPTAAQMEEFIGKAVLLHDVVEVSELTPSPFRQEDDAMQFEGLRILIAAHAYTREFPVITAEKIELVNEFVLNDQPQIEALPLLTMEELVADSLGETPRDPYHPSLRLIIATQQTGTVSIFSSQSEKYARLVSGELLESIPETDYHSWFGPGHYPYSPFLSGEDFSPRYKSLSFQLVPLPHQDFNPIGTQNLELPDE